MVIRFSWFIFYQKKTFCTVVNGQEGNISFLAYEVSDIDFLWSTYDQMWQLTNNITSCQKNYKAQDQATSCQYLFLLPKTKSSMPNDLYLLGLNEEDDSGWSDKSLNVDKLQSFYWNNWSKRSNRALGFYQIGRK